MDLAYFIQDENIPVQVISVDFEKKPQNIWYFRMAIASHTRMHETSAWCLRSTDLSLGMRQLFGDVTVD